MRAFIILLILVYGVFCFGQNSYDNPYIKFYEKNDHPYFYNERLGVSDKNAVIISASGVSEVMNCESYLVLLSNGSMFMYGLNTSSKPYKIVKKEVSDSVEKQKFLVILDRVNSLYRFNSNDILSHAFWQELMKDDNMLVLDGTSYSIVVTQGKRKASYYSYAAETYIRYKKPGLELRKQFVKLIDELDFSAELFCPFILPEIDFQNTNFQVPFRVKQILYNKPDAIVISTKEIYLKNVKENFIALCPDGSLFFYKYNNNGILKESEIVGNTRLYVISKIRQLNGLDCTISNKKHTLEEVKDLIGSNNVNYILEIYKENAYSKFECYDTEEKFSGYETCRNFREIMNSLDF